MLGNIKIICKQLGLNVPPIASTAPRGKQALNMSAKYQGQV